MRLRFLALFLLGILMFAPVAKAAGVGFVPNDRLWFSDVSSNPADGKKIYTVVINSDYNFLDATIGFYVNDQLVDTANVNQLPKDQVVQVFGVWHPTEGNYKVSVQFIKAQAADQNGQQLKLDLGALNNITTSTNIQTSDSGLAPAVDLNVEKNGDALTISKAPNPIKDFESRIEAASQQQEDIKNKIGNTVNMISSTASNISDLPSKAKSILSQSKDFFTGNNFLFYLGLAKDALANFMDKVTNHYEPKRSAIVFGIFLGSLILVYTIIWFLKRRDEY